jgi:hypothetical protein
MDELRVCEWTPQKVEALRALRETVTRRNKVKWTQIAELVAEFGPPETRGHRVCALRRSVRDATEFSFHPLLRKEELYRALQRKLKARSDAGDADAQLQYGRVLIAQGRQLEGLELLMPLGGPARRVLIEYFLHRMADLPEEQERLRRRFFLQIRLNGTAQEVGSRVLIFERERRDRAALALSAGRAGTRYQRVRERIEERFRGQKA